MGGRGASSESTGRKTTFENIMKLSDKVPYTINFEKTVFITPKNYIGNSYKYKDVKYDKINEAVVRMPYTNKNKIIKMLTEKGYKMLEEYSNGKKITNNTWIHIKR